MVILVHGQRVGSDLVQHILPRRPELRIDAEDLRVAQEVAEAALGEGQVLPKKRLMSRRFESILLHEGCFRRTGGALLE